MGRKSSIARADDVRKHFRRRKAATKAGVHLPTEAELLLSMGFFKGDIVSDVREASHRWQRRLHASNRPEDAGLISILEELSLDPDIACLKRLASELAGHNVANTDQRFGSHDRLRPLKLRNRIYLAHLGDVTAAQNLACDAVVMAANEARKETVEDFGYLWSAVGWILLASGCGYEAYSEATPRRWESPALPDASSTYFFEHRFKHALLSKHEQDAYFAAKGGVSVAGADEADPEGETVPEEHGLLVFSAVGNSGVAEGRKVEKEFGRVLGQRLRLVPLPDLSIVRDRLAAEFPHAVAVIDAILRGLAGMPHIRIPPTILVGSPGGGKTRFARRICEELGLPVEVAPCGGVSDGSWGGTARRWSSGEPSLPVSLILRTEIANPALVLDEIEKIGTSRHNGNVADTMLAMLERETAARFHDPYVQAACDLSQVSWLMTANELAGLHAPFRDRCRVIRFPDPGSEHLEHYANALLADAVRDEGLGDGWIVRLDGTELERLADHWRGGSLRKLRRLVEAVHEARRETAQRH